MHHAMQKSNPYVAKVTRVQRHQTLGTTQSTHLLTAEKVKQQYTANGDKNKPNMK